MKLMVLGADMSNLAAIDAFSSFIWTERYWEYGDFELVLAPSNEMVELFKPDRYLWYEGTNELMIIEDIAISSAIDAGAEMTINGRSLTSLLDRRIVWEATTLKGTISECVKKLLNENIIAASDAKRNVTNLVYREPTTFDPSTITIDSGIEQGESLYDVIESLCRSKRIGFHIFNDPENDGQFIFQLYNGADHSYAQTTNPYVVFSNDFQSLVNTNVKTTNSTRKNVALVKGPEVDEKLYLGYAELEGTSPTGIDRRETFVQASDIKTEDDAQQKLPDDQIVEQLNQSGSESLAKLGVETEFDGETDQNGQFQYQRDYFMGDICQMDNEYGMSFQSRITEYIRSQDGNGFSAYPSFTVVGQEGDD